MTTQIRAFRSLAPTQNIVVTAASQTVTLNNTSGTRALRLCNIGTQVVFINFNATGDVNSGIALPAGQTEIFTIGNDILNFGVIAGATGSTLYSTVGEGL